METIAAFGKKLTSRFSLRSRTNFFPVSKLYCLPVTSFPGKPGHHDRLKATSTLRCEDQEGIRKFKKLPASEWTQRFHSVSIDVLEIDALRREIDSLKPKVWNKFMSCQGIERILNMYLLVSLGLEYHFEDEICETLKEDSEKIEEMIASEEDLYTVSIIFWVFRTYGHYISSDVFRRFKGNNGNFKESLKRDAEGILSLYEAANLRTTKDYILDEALSFASCHVESLAAGGTCPPRLSKRIRNALCLSQNWNMDMLVAMEFIPYYEQENDHDEMLLKFSKLSFNLIQLQYLQELKIVIKWYKEVDFASKLPPYFRDRIVENHFFAQTVFFEPQHSRERIMLIQYFTLLGLQDDTLDRYASLPEAESLVNSLDRWAPDHAMDEQPDYLKFVFKFILDTFEGFEKELSPEGKTFIVKATIEEYKTLVKANFELEKWASAAHVPSFEKYMEVAGVGVASIGTLAGTLMCMGNVVTMEAYEWLKSRPKLIQAICIKGRLVNDMTGFKEDMSRGYAANAITCYMKQYGVTEQEALCELNKMVVDADKTFRQEFLTTTGVSRLALKAAMGVAVMLAITYNGYEGYTHPEGKIKEYMTSIFVDQIQL